MARRIQKLDVSVVNKIAAGEIIIQPANALKEILENSIDAHATVIDIVVKDGGTKLLQVTDNGDGINKEDLPLLCERFATSKLQKFEDLQSIATYGFRGEALASISHIARLSVVTKTSESSVAYKAFYLNGGLTGPNFKQQGDVTVKPVAGKNGTQITVEDLFYNIPARLKSLRSKNEELLKILDVVGKYAVHTQGVGFSCKKFGESQQTILTRASFSLKDRIRTVYGSEVSNELIDIELMGNKIEEGQTESLKDQYGLIKITGAISNSNYNNKKRAQTMFFINHRLVTCEPLRRGIVSTYQFFLPRGTAPFIYLSLELDPQILDVNVHPTKREVRFLHEEEIIDVVKSKVHDLLSSVDTSRKFKSQGFLASLKRQSEEYEQTHAKKYRQENKLVRVDASQSKLNPFLKRKAKERNESQADTLETEDNQPASHTNTRTEEYINNEEKETFTTETRQEKLGLSEPAEPSAPIENQTELEEGDLFVDNHSEGDIVEDETIEEKKAQLRRLGNPITNIAQVRNETMQEDLEQEIEFQISESEINSPTSGEATRLDLHDARSTDDEVDSEPELFPVELTERSHMKVSLLSIQELKENLIESVDRSLTKIFQTSSYIGVMDETKRLCCFQSDVKLFLCDYGTVVNDFFYQTALQEFCNYGEFVFAKPISVRSLLEPLYELQEGLVPMDDVISALDNVREMYKEYFSVEFKREGSELLLLTLPMIIREISPNINKLPFFLYRLATKIDYEDEKRCLEGIIRQISLFYVPESTHNDKEKREQINATLDDTIFPLLRQRYLATSKAQSAVVQIADLPGLYKIFERC